MIKFIKITNDGIIYINKNCIVSACAHNYDNSYNTGLTITNGEYIVVKGKLEDIVKQIEEE